MAFKPIITYKGSPEQKGKKLPEYVAAAMERAVLAWHHGQDPLFKGQSAGFLPFHFTQQAYFRYPDVCRSRSAKYERRKERLYGHKNPLVWTGTTQAAVSRSITVTVRGKQARGTMTGANRALNFSGGKLREELLAVNEREAAALAAGIEALVAVELNKDEPATPVA
jgi:hypothetical protein